MEAGRGRRACPNKWFNNVEVFVDRQVGHETVTYVSNIYGVRALMPPPALDVKLGQRACQGSIH